VGGNGDFYLNTANGDIYGPKTAGAWGSVIFNIAEGQQGPAGPQGSTGATGGAGSAGADGRTLLSGTSAPSSGTGVNGDFFINTAASIIYGPKAGGAWPTGVSLAGPTGATGATGQAGPAGPAGQGVPTGGATGEVLVKVGDGNYQTGWAASVEWSASTVSQAEAETGAATTRRAFTPQRVRQAIEAWWAAISTSAGRALVEAANAGAQRTALGLGTAATAAATDFAAAAHNQAASTITGLAAVATSGSASDLTTGTLPAARIPATAVTAGSYTYGSFTVDAAGRLTAASSGAAPVTGVTGTAPIVSSGGATPAISISIGTTAGTVAAGDDSRITGALSAATAATTYQPLDADLTSIAALTTASAGRSLLTLAAVPSGALVGTTDTQTLSAKTLGSLQESLFTITDAAAFEINPANGPIQTVTLGANRTPAATSFASGQSVKLKIDDGTAFAITWTTVGVVWIGQTAGSSGTAPTLGATGWTHIELWKEGSIIYGALIGYSAT
jgi:hypothetical protein